MTRSSHTVRRLGLLLVVLLATIGLSGEPARSAGARPAGELVHWSETNGGGPVDQEYTRAEAVKVAQRYDLISALRWTFRSHADAMRAANPDFTLMMYQNGAFARKGEGTAFPASWYLRDAQGRKITSVTWGNFLMDPARRGWQDQVAAECREYIAFGNGDGCHLDDLGWGNHISDNLSGTAINPATGEPYTESEWLAAATALAKRVTTVLGDDVVVGGNGLNHGRRWFGPDGGSRRVAAAMDYGVAEGFLRGEKTPLDRFRREEIWKQDVDMLVDAGDRGLTVMTMTKIWTPATQAEVNRWRLYSLASFLMGTNGDHHFFFNAEDPGKPPAVHPWDDLDLGVATGDYAKSGGVYQRRFEHGRVLVNPTTTARTIQLGGTHIDIWGNRVTQVRLQPNTGMIVRPETAPEPEPEPDPGPEPEPEPEPDPGPEPGPEPGQGDAAPATCAGIAATIVGTSGPDRLVGTPGRDIISAGPGADKVFGRGGDDVICGHAGDDHIEAEAGDDLVRAGKGADKVFGGDGDDTLHGEADDDLIRGQAGADRLFGGKGDDYCGLGGGGLWMRDCTDLYP